VFLTAGIPDVDGDATFPEVGTEIHTGLLDESAFSVS
jgi:hypothetical protein